MREVRAGKEFEINVRVVSSAKRRDVLFERAFGKSLMYSRKRMGPRTEPCGTPHVIGSGFEELA